MTLDPEMKENFPDPPLVAYKRPQTIRNKLIRAKVPSLKSKPRRVINGMHKCKKSCDICPYVKAGKVIKAAHTDVKVHLQKHHDCESRNIVYIIQCKKCWWAQYIGETKHSLGKNSKNKSRVESENGLLGGRVSDLFHFFKTL